MTKSKCHVSRVTSHEYMHVARVVLGVLIVGSFLISPAPLVAQDEYGLDTVAGSAQLKGLGSDVPKITGRFLGAALSLVGILFFMLTIYGGVLWMTAHGNAEQATKGLNTAIAAIVGLVIVLSSYAITNFVFKTVEGGEQTAATSASAGSVRVGGSCTGNNQCEPRTDCVQGRCQSFCDLMFGHRGNYACREASQCDAASIQIGECPGGNNIRCCLPISNPGQAGRMPSPSVEP